MVSVVSSGRRAAACGDGEATAEVLLCVLPLLLLSIEDNMSTSLDVLWGCTEVGVVGGRGGDVCSGDRLRAYGFLMTVSQVVWLFSDGMELARGAWCVTMSFWGVVGELISDVCNDDCFVDNLRAYGFLIAVGLDVWGFGGCCAMRDGKALSL